MFKVLIVDDDEVVCMFLGRLLANKFNCDVLQAENGLEALSAIEKENPDIIFLDITMPVMNGVETLEIIRKDAKFAKLPVIMLTALKDKETVSNVMTLGVMAYLLKPLQYNSAYEKIKEIFEQIKKEKERKSFMKEKNLNSIPKILIVEGDNEFRSIISKKLDKAFEVIESSSGAEGLKIYMQKSPNIVLLGENLALLNEFHLSKKIQEINNEHKKTDVLIYLINKSGIIEEKYNGLFNGVIQKNSNVGLFLKTLGEVIKEAYK